MSPKPREPRGPAAEGGRRRPLGARKAAVLRAVVRDYIRSAEPVGSGRIAGRYRLGVSPATIRNDMAALEDMGYLAQPHTSAGRIPTDRGYRFYVDTLPPRLRLSDAHRRAIAEFLGEPLGDVEDALRRTAHVLSRLTRYVAVALSPVLARSRVLRAELVPLGSSALLLVVSDTGRVDRGTMDLSEEQDEDTVRQVSERVMASCAGLSYEDAAARVEALGGSAGPKERQLLAATAEALRRLAEDPGSQHVFLEGVANIAGEEAFERRETVRRVFEALEERPLVLRLLRELPSGSQEVLVRIGSENRLSAMREASVVLAPYHASGRPVGSIAVIGPTRMEYASAICSVQAVARRVSEVVEALAG